MTGRAGGFDETETGILRYFVNRPLAGSSRAVFLDRDGVINRRIVGGYVTDWSEFEFLPGAIDGIVRLSAHDAPIIVVSNQAGVGKGLIDLPRLLDITQRLVETVQRFGGRIDAVYYCPHVPAAGCACRKPKPGLLLEAARDWAIDVRASVMIGDSDSDAEAGRAAGCEVVLLSSVSVVGLYSAAEIVCARLRLIE